MQPRTVVHLIDELKVGGAQTHLVTMLAYLRRFPQFDHRVVTLFGDGPMADPILNLGVELTILDLRHQFAHWRFDQAVELLRQTLASMRPDLVEAHLTWSRLLGLFAARTLSVPQRIGFEVGDIYLHSPPIRAWNFTSQAYIDKLIVCSAALGHWVYQTHRIRNSKMTILHNCVDATTFNPSIPPAGDIAAWKRPDTVLFAMIGSLGDGVNKRTDIGIRALAQVRNAGFDVDLVIAGDGNQRPELEQMASTLGIADHVRFLGVRSDIPGVLAACDGFCHAAPFEPFGIVALEAMAMGLPVIVPDQGGIAEAVQPGLTGFIYPALDVQGLSRSMITLASQPEVRTTMGKAARQDVLGRFTVEQYVHRLYMLYGYPLQ